MNESSGYDVINDEDLIKAHYEMSEELVGSSKKSGDNDDYEGPYFEPADQEGELMAQLSNLSLPVISAEYVE